MSNWAEVAKTLGGNRSGNSLKAHYRTLTDPRYQIGPKLKGPKHGRGLLPSMAKKAMKQMGGESTCPDLLAFCRENASIQQEFGPSLNWRMTKITGTTRELPAWEASISTNVHTYFRKSFCRKGRHAVWVLMP